MEGQFKDELKLLKKFARRTMYCGMFLAVV